MRLLGDDGRLDGRKFGIAAGVERLGQDRGKLGMRHRGALAAGEGSGKPCVRGAARTSPRGYAVLRPSMSAAFHAAFVAASAASPIAAPAITSVG